MACRLYGAAIACFHCPDAAGRRLARRLGRFFRPRLALVLVAAAGNSILVTLGLMNPLLMAPAQSGFNLIAVAWQLSPRPSLSFGRRRGWKGLLRSGSTAAIRGIEFTARPGVSRS